MAAPNLRSPNTVTGKTAVAQLAATTSTVLENAAASGKVFKVNAVRAANLTTGDVSVDICHYRGTTTTHLLKGGIVGGGKTLIITNKDEYIYLEEGDSLQALAGAATSIDMTINYEEIS